MKTDALWLAFSADIRAWLHRRTRDEALTEDLLQETFLRVHIGLPRLRDHQRIAPWLYRVARSVLIDHQRRSRRLEPLQQEPTSPEPEDNAADVLVASWLPQLLESLPEHYREPLRLAELEGLSQAEIAQRLSLSPSGARTRIQRGRRQLRERLLACCEVTLEGGQVLDWRPQSGGCPC